MGGEFLKEITVRLVKCSAASYGNCELGLQDKKKRIIYGVSRNSHAHWNEVLWVALCIAVKWTFHRVPQKWNGKRSCRMPARLMTRAESVNKAHTPFCLCQPHHYTSLITFRSTAMIHFPVTHSFYTHKYVMDWHWWLCIAYLLRVISVNQPDTTLNSNAFVKLAQIQTENCSSCSCNACNCNATCFVHQFPIDGPGNKRIYQFVLSEEHFRHWRSKTANVHSGRIDSSKLQISLLIKTAFSLNYFLFVVYWKERGFLLEVSGIYTSAMLIFVSKTDVTEMWGNIVCLLSLNEFSSW